MKDSNLARLKQLIGTVSFDSKVYLPIPTAAEVMGISNEMMRRLCRLGRVSAIKKGGAWFVNIAAPRKKGRFGPTPRFISLKTSRGSQRELGDAIPEGGRIRET